MTRSPRPPILIRRATPADAAAIALVHVAAWRETYAGLMPESLYGAEALECRRAMWTRLLNAEPAPGRLNVVDLGGNVVGFAHVDAAQGMNGEERYVPVRALQLYTIYLLAAHHGTGAAQALLDETLGNEPAQLWVAAANKRARAFYARNGFRPDGMEYVDVAFPGLPEVRLVR